MRGPASRVVFPCVMCPSPTGSYFLPGVRLPLRSLWSRLETRGSKRSVSQCVAAVRRRRGRSPLLRVARPCASPPPSMLAAPGVLPTLSLALEALCPWCRSCRGFFAAAVPDETSSRR
ncbi:hypothetical protein NDU88_000634 [Pleurodeles waltl]|uniref:Uncharacterized protein n=1 Tax=Pleurodeles waltl TaxID=8319 RepID=A0AAV7TGW1_PLEWA|nr:hypothetical protein NDU88_000634 [Pleurodeles waltl]